MSELAIEIITGKAELVYLHWSFPFVLVCVNVFLVWKYFPAHRRILGATSSKTWMRVTVYVVVIGVIASLFGALTHSMFSWSVWQRLPYAIVGILLAMPPVIQILIDVRQEELEQRDKSKSAPVLLTATYFAVTFVFCITPLTAIE